MNIAIILPYKENYSNFGAGAVSLWVKDFLKYTKFKKSITIFGQSISKKRKFSKNFCNIKINDHNFLESNTKKYCEKILSVMNNKKFDIIEIHNRPNVVNYFYNKTNSKIILYLHNDPHTMKGSKTSFERNELLNKCDKIIFISKWVKNKFFEQIKNINENKTDIVYHSINPLKKNNLNKKKQIVFVGKLNKSKGYDLFCKSMIDVLNKFPDWKAITAGDEKRFIKYPIHKKQYNLGLLTNDNILKVFEESEIAVIPSKWEEPFGRTALEATSRGCATIISNRGGLPETSDEVLIIKNLDHDAISKKIFFLINNEKIRRKIQLNSKKNVKHELKFSSIKIDNIRESIFPNFFYQKQKYLRILNIYNFGQKLFHRIYNLSLGKKLTNGFIRNGHDVIEISDRDTIRNLKTSNIFNYKKKFEDYILRTIQNYQPHILFFGHSKNINSSLIQEIRKQNTEIIISHWNEDPFNIYENGKNENYDNLKNLLKYVDNTFITTATDINCFRNIKSSNLFFFLTPVDSNIENFKVFNLSPKFDLFYAMSHGVNRGNLKDGKEDDRALFLDKLIKKNHSLKFDLYGYNDRQPVWGLDFLKCLTNSKMALNLSRGRPTKYYSSNRIASLMGNGLLTFVHKKIQLSDFFTKNELIEYEHIDDLMNKLIFYSKNDEIRKKFAKRGRDKYFKRFNEKRIAKYFIDKSTGRSGSL